MNPIKEFFKKKLEKRQAEKNFRNAGPGHRLADPGGGSSSNARNTPFVPTQRCPPNEVAKKAAEAAMARYEREKTAPVNWSLSAVRAQAKKELELEEKNKNEPPKLPKEVVQESCPYLTVSGVYFACPIIGPQVLSRREIEANIKEFLYQQLEEERGLTSCLIIHSCNQNKEKVKLGIETLLKYLANIIDNPTDAKYRKIRINNKVFQEKVATLEGVYDFLTSCGFVRQILHQDGKNEEFFIFPEEQLEDLDNLQMLKEALMSAEPIRPILDRNKKVLMPSQASENINLPDDFFNLTMEELQKEQEDREQTVELLTTLRTKAMREKYQTRELRFYKYTLVRIRFPDGIILQGTFNVREKIHAVKEFIVENLEHSERQFAVLAPGGIKLTEEDDKNTLLDLKLVPAILLNLQFDKEDNSMEETAYLKQETMCLLQNL